MNDLLLTVIPGDCGIGCPPCIWTSFNGNAKIIAVHSRETHTLKCLNIGTPKNIKFPFGAVFN